MGHVVNMVVIPWLVIGLFVGYQLGKAVYKDKKK